MKMRPSCSQLSTDISPFSFQISAAAALLSNYQTLRHRYWETFQRMEYASLEKELILANRFPMQDLIDKVRTEKRKNVNGERCQ